jgi:antitoxin VapB
MLTRVFQSGNSLAVRIPKELAFMAAAQDVEIERQGNTLVVKPVEQRTLAGLGAALRLFPSDFMADGRERHEQRERNWGGAASPARTGKKTGGA